MRYILILILTSFCLNAECSTIDRDKVPITVYDNIDTTVCLSIVGETWYMIDKDTMQPINKKQSDPLVFYFFVFLIGMLIGILIMLTIFD